MHWHHSPLSCSMAASNCLLHVGQLPLPIQHRVRAAALQVHAAVQQGQKSRRAKQYKQQPSSKQGSSRQQQQQQQQTGYAGEPWESLQVWQQPSDARQQWLSDPLLLQQQSYVPEPWELQEQPADVDHQQQQQSQDRINSSNDTGWGHQRQQQQRQAPVVDQQSYVTSSSSGEYAAGELVSETKVDDADGAEEYDDDGDGDDNADVWLLHSSDNDEQQQDQEDGWLQETDDIDDGQQRDTNSSRGSGASYLRSTPAQRYARQQVLARQQQEQQRSGDGATEWDATAVTTLSSSSSSSSADDLQVAWDAALSSAMTLLASYDVRYDVSRQPPLSSSSSNRKAGAVPPEEVSLTAAAAAAAAKAKHTRRQQTVTGSAVPYLPDAEQTLQSADSTAATITQQQQPQQSMTPVLPDDPRWQAVQRSHAAYLTYMQQLAAMVVSKQQQSHQIVYQVGICEHWLQLDHILSVFGGPQMSAAVTAAMWKKLTGIITRKVFSRMSHSERCSYDMFIDRLVQQSIVSITRHSSSSSKLGSSSSDSNSSSSSSSNSPSQLAATVYGMAVLGVSSPELCTAVMQAAAASLSQAAAEVQTAAAVEVDDPSVLQQQQQHAGKFRSSGATQGQQQQRTSNSPATAAAVCGWGPSEVASMLWGLGTINIVKASSHDSWLQDMTTVTGHIISRCQPSQLWGVIWGFARLGFSPPDPWLNSWLAAARQQFDGFNAEALSHSVWALAALQYTPDKLWLRAFCGMVAYKIRSFMSGHLSLVLPALSSLGYKPRQELCTTIIAQTRRQLHTFQPSQLSAVLTAIASYAPLPGAAASTSGWQPGQLFLFDFISHSSAAAVMHAWTADQAAQVLWAFSRFRYVPDRSYLKSLLSHLQPRLISCSPDSLAMALWGLAALRQQIPSNTWAAAWCTAAAGKADQFGPQALAHGLSAMAALGVRPPAQLMQALTRTASGCLSDFSCMELGLLIAALADLHWRPTDDWMKVFVSQVSHQLPAFENEDFGLLLFGLASLAQPLPPSLLARLCAGVKSKLYGLSGEGLGLLVWGLAQYGYEMKNADDWWSAVFAEFGNKWQSATLRGCALAGVGLSQLGPQHLPTGLWEAQLINRYKTLSSRKPRTWFDLLMDLRTAAGMEPGEQLVMTPWLSQLLLQLGRSWNLPDTSDSDNGSLAAVNAQVTATAAALAGEGNTSLSGSSSVAAISLQLSGVGAGTAAVGSDVDGFVEVSVRSDGWASTSATAVLL